MPHSDPSAYDIAWSNDSHRRSEIQRLSERVAALEGQVAWLVAAISSDSKRAQREDEQ